MPPEASKLVFDMRAACELISSFTAGMSYGDYKADACVQSAVERQFQIVGEALHQLFKAHPEVASRIPAHRDIINFRHVLVHGYDKVEDEVVWGVVKANLPGLLDTLNGFLEE